MDILEFVLSPIVIVMTLVLAFYQHIFSSTGIAIILLSFTFSLFMIPLQRWGNRIEKKIKENTQRVDVETGPLKQRLKGEELFLEIDKIYKKYNYHPINRVWIGVSFLVMLPILLSALVLFTSIGALAGETFLIINDLSQPDGLLGPINLLPLFMFGVTVIDAKLRFKDNKKIQYQFYFISIILLVIVYNLAAGLVLYWIGSNIMSLFLNRISQVVVADRLLKAGSMFRITMLYQRWPFRRSAFRRRPRQ